MSTTRLSDENECAVRLSLLCGIHALIERHLLTSGPLDQKAREAFQLFKVYLSTHLHSFHGFVPDMVLIRDKGSKHWFSKSKIGFPQGGVTICV